MLVLIDNVGKDLNRLGVIKKVKLPKNTKKIDSYNLKLDLKNKEIYFESGESIYIVSSLIGIREEVEFTVIPCGNQMIYEIHWGNLYYKTDDNQVYSINETGTAPQKITNVSNIEWLKTDRVYSYLDLNVSLRYNIPDNKIQRTYTDNLMFTLLCSNKPIILKRQNVEEITDNYVLSVKVTGLYDDLSLGEFEFKANPKVEKLNVIGKDRNELTRDEIDKLAEIERKREIEQAKKEKQLELEYKRVKDGEDVVYYDEDSYETAGFEEADIEKLVHSDDNEDN